LSELRQKKNIYAIIISKRGEEKQATQQNTEEEIAKAKKTKYS
jgi:hypothetical protein